MGMELKELGTTGAKVPEVGIGTYRYEAGPGLLRKAVELGAFLIDTAEPREIARSVDISPRRRSAIYDHY